MYTNRPIYSRILFRTVCALYAPRGSQQRRQMAMFYSASVTTIRQSRDGNGIREECGKERNEEIKERKKEVKG